jgi:hypothetical protein
MHIRSTQELIESLVIFEQMTQTQNRNGGIRGMIELYNNLVVEKSDGQYKLFSIHPAQNTRYLLKEFNNEADADEFTFNCKSKIEELTKELNRHTEDFVGEYSESQNVARSKIFSTPLFVERITKGETYDRPYDPYF